MSSKKTALEYASKLEKAPLCTYLKDEYYIKLMAGYTDKNGDPAQEGSADCDQLYVEELVHNFDEQTQAPYIKYSKLTMDARWFEELAAELGAPIGFILAGIVARFHDVYALDEFASFCDSNALPYSLHVDISNPPEHYY